MGKSDTVSETTDVESPSAEASTSTLKIFKWEFPRVGTKVSLQISLFGTIVGLIILCFGIGIYSLKHTEDLEKVRVEPPVFVSEDDDDLAFDLRPNINIVIPSTKEPSESPMFTSPPTFVTQDSETLLQELRSIFGQEISMKIQSRHSPLSMAYNWILYQDQYVKSNSNVLTVQRFMLAAFYFSTGGRRATASWDQCSAVPENTQEDENMDPDLPIRCVFEGGQSVCASLDEFLECSEYYRDWQKPPITPKKRWLSNSFECDWYGISCNANGEVYKISLPNNGLEGSLIPEITALEKLTNINLDHNAIGGPLPSLNKLDIHELSLAWNNFVGRLELSDQWQNLERLVLGDGTISTLV